MNNLSGEWRCDLGLLLRWNRQEDKCAGGTKPKGAVTVAARRK